MRTLRVICKKLLTNCLGFGKNHCEKIEKYQFEILDASTITISIRKGIHP